MLNWSMNLFRIRGIQLAVHLSFAVLPLLVGWEGWQAAGWQGALYGLGTLLTFFTCVVLHELGHAEMARKLGIRVPRILLLPIGGMAEFERIPKKPREELLIAIAGPLVNVVLVSLLCLFVRFPAAWSEGTVSGFLSVFNDDTGLLPEDPALLGVNGFAVVMLCANAVMALFNLIPVFPMDGGRVLRALLATRMSYLRATHIASTLGKVLAASLVVFALLNGFWMPAILFAFIFWAGDAEYRMLKREEERNEWLRRIQLVTTSGPLGTDFNRPIAPWEPRGAEQPHRSPPPLPPGDKPPGEPPENGGGI